MHRQWTNLCHVLLPSFVRIEPERGNLAAQSSSVDSEDLGGLRDVPLDVIQHSLKKSQLRCALPPGIKVAGPLLQAIIDKVVQITKCGDCERWSVDPFHGIT